MFRIIDDWSNHLSGRMARVSRRPMLLAFAMSMIGMAIARISPAWIPWGAVVMANIGLWLLVVVVWQRHTMLPCLLLVLPSLTAWRDQIREQSISRDRLHRMASDIWTPVVLKGCVESTPHWRPNLLRLRGTPQESDLDSDDQWETLLEVSVASIRDHRTWKDGDYGKMQIAIEGRVRHLLPGDEVECMIDWQRIGPPTNPGQYDLSERYRRMGVWVRGRSDVSTQIKRIGLSSAWRIDRWLSRIVIAADVAFHRYVPYRQATMASALVIGQREQVEWSMQESLLATGTIHMLAISGMHIEMVAMSIVFFCSLLRVPRRAMLLLTMSVVVAYSLLCGGNPPVARAAVLVVAMGITRWIGKTSDSMNLLGFAAVVVLLYRPSDWLEIGTQLSFLAVCVLILISGELRDAVRRDRLDELLLTRSHVLWKGWNYMVRYGMELLRTSLWVWLLTCPLVLFSFHVFSPIAVLLNLVLWIPMLLALLAGLVLLVVGPLSPWLGYPVGWFCGVCLLLSDQIVHFSEKLPLSHFWIPAPPVWWCVSFYVCLLLLIGLFGFQRSARRGAFAFAAVWISLGALPAIEPCLVAWMGWDRNDRAGKLELTFIDVGHGTSVLIRTPTGSFWLYDAGRLGDAQRSYLGIAGVLWDNRTSRIDRLFLSHADSDHFNAMMGLSRRFAIGRLMTTRSVVESASPLLCETLAVFRQQRIPIELQHEGDTLDEETLRCAVLHPPREEVKGNDNARSLCLAMEYAGHRLLLLGDLEGEGIKRLIASTARKASVMMAPHHGSLAESPQPLLEWCQPDTVIVSGGTRARHPKVSAAYRAGGRQVLITAVDCAIRCTVDRDGRLQLERWRHPQWVDCQEKRGK